MASLREAEEVYGRYPELRDIGVLYSCVADVILRLEAERDKLRAAMRDTIYRVEDVLEGAAIDDGIVQVAALTRLDAHYFQVLKPMRADVVDEATNAQR